MLGRAYFGYLIVLCVVFVAVTAVSAADIGLVLKGVPVGFWVLVGLAVIVETPLFTLMGPGYRAPVLASVSFAFALSIGWGHGTGRTTQTAAIVVGAALSRREIWAVVFDIGRYGLALSGAGLVAVWVVRRYPVPSDVSHLGYVLAAATVWCLVFRLLTATESWLREGGRWRQSLVTGVRAEALSAGALLLLSPMFLAIMQVNAWLIPLVLVPLYAVSTMGRLWYEQSQRYLVDALTGLGNRAAMARETKRVTTRVAGGDRLEPGDGHARGIVALLEVDVDQFQLINEALGYRVADQVLIAVGHRLRLQAGPDAAVCRLKGDEFGVLLSRVSCEEEALARAGTIRAQFAEPIPVEGQPLTVDASVGVAIYPHHGADFDTLAQHADAAMHRARELPDRVAVFEPDIESLGPRRWALLADLRRILDQPGSREIAPYYQPQIDLVTNEVVGVEALLRWYHPTRGMISPEEVIRAAERSTAMQQLTRRMIEQVLDQLRLWWAGGFTVRASVNVSVRDLCINDFAPWLAEQLRQRGVAPAGLQLEMTESAVMTQPGAVLASLQSLRALGIGAALDDFGTGFSSLEHLRRLPLTEVKIDRSFTQSMVADSGAAAIVRAIIDLANELDLRVVAEGVEDERTRQHLLAVGCHLAQGWYYAGALPVGEFDPWLAAHQSTGH